MTVDKSGVYWFVGKSKIVVTPWVYLIPDFSFIDPAQYKKFTKCRKIQDEKPKKTIVHPVQVVAKRCKPAPLNQQILF